MYAKYRVFVATTRGIYYAAAANSVNGLVDLVRKWLDESSAGRSVYDDMVREVVLMQLDDESGMYQTEQRVPASNRKDIIAKLRALDGR